MKTTRWILLAAWLALACLAAVAFDAGPSAIMELAASPSQAEIAVLQIRFEGSRVEIWSTDEEPRRIRSLHLPTFPAYSLRYLDHDRLVLAGPNVAVLDIRSGKRLWESSPRSQSHPRIATGGGRFAIGDAKQISVIDGTSFQYLWTWTNLGQPSSMRMSSDGRFLRIESPNVLILDVEQPRHIRKADPAPPTPGTESDDGGNAFLPTEVSENAFAALQRSFSEEYFASKHQSLPIAFADAAQMASGDIVYLQARTRALGVWSPGSDDPHRILDTTSGPHMLEPLPDRNACFLAQHTGALRRLDAVSRKISGPLYTDLHLSVQIGWLIWCAAWLATMRTPESSGWKTLRDLTLVYALPLVYFPISLGVTGRIMSGSTMELAGFCGSTASCCGLLVMWFVLGPGRWSLRLSLVLLGMATIWAIALSGPSWLQSEMNLGGTLLLGLLTTGFAIFRLVTKNQLFRARPKSGVRRPSTQWPLRDILLTTGACGLLARVASIGMEAERMILQMAWSGLIASCLILFLSLAASIWLVLATEFAFWGRLTIFALVTTTCTLIILTLQWFFVPESPLLAQLLGFTLGFACLGSAILRLHGFRIGRLDNPRIETPAPSASPVAI